jgi:UDPglucose 6-dehydrogenase
MAIENVRRDLPHFEAVSEVADAFKNADLVVIATEWRSYAAILPSDVESLVKHKNMILARKVVDEKLWQDHGWNVKALGRA